MKFDTRKEVQKVIDYFKRLLAIHDDVEKDLLDEYLGADHLNLHKEKILEAIKKLEAIHDSIPMGYFFKGPYYVKSHPDFNAVEKQEHLFLKDGLVTWATVDPKFTLWNYQRYPYRDQGLSQLVRKEDGVPVYSHHELVELSVKEKF
jgi:hypothetical protein